MGYFVLGPSDLYKLTKEIGKTYQHFRTFTTEATASLEKSLESNFQLEEIRKAQRDLNEAFSFRRSINVDADADTDLFEVNAKSERGGSVSDRMATATETATATAVAVANSGGDATVMDQAAPAPAACKKNIRRRLKKRSSRTWWSKRKKRSLLCESGCQAWQCTSGFGYDGCFRTSRRENRLGVGES